MPLCDRRDIEVKIIKNYEDIIDFLITKCIDNNIDVKDIVPLLTENTMLMEELNK